MIKGTVTDRDHVITFLKVHKSLSEAIDLAEKAREVLINPPTKTNTTSLKKIIMDGEPKAEVKLTIEEAIEAARYGEKTEVKLAANEP